MIVKKQRTKSNHPMNLTKTLITLLVCLLPLSPSAGELDGKGLICKKIEHNQVPWDTNVLMMFRFADDMAYENLFIEINDERVLQKLSEEDISGNPINRGYRTTFDKIQIYEIGTIDRNNLLLTVGDGTAFGKNSHRCDIVHTRLEYYEVLLLMQNEFQKQVDEVISNRQL